MNSPENKQEETSREDRFFGVKTTIEKPKPKTKEEIEAEKITIETESDEPTAVDVKPEPEAKSEKKDKDDLDDEMSGYSQKVQKRIDHLTWQANEEKRNREKAEALREEAVRYAQQVNSQNAKQAEIIANGEAKLVEQIKSRAQAAVNAAKANYRIVYDEGDTNKIIEAQEEIARAQAEMLEANRYGHDYEQRLQHWKQQQQQQELIRQRAAQQQHQRQPVPQQPAVRQPSPESQSWMQRNPWFGKEEHRDMTALAYATHEKLIRDKGMKPDTEQYYAALDAEIKLRFPEYGNSGNSQNAPNTVVAPGNRNNGGKPRTVKLSKTQVDLARKLGVTLEQYAEQVLKGAR